MRPLFSGPGRLWWAALLISVGCSETIPDVPQPDAAPLPVVVAPEVAAPPSPQARQPASEAPPPKREAAQAGVTGRGEYGLGVVTTSLKAYFSVQERLVYDVQIPSALQKFEALYDRRPHSHDEFMRDVVGANGIALPELPPLHRYVYDPARGELMVEHPAPNSP